MLTQHLTQKHQLRIHSQQLQMLHLFHLNALQLEQHLKTELEENPFLEEITDADTEKANKNEEEEVQDYQDWDEYGYENLPDRSSNYNALNGIDWNNKSTVYAEDFRYNLCQQLNFLELSPEEEQLGNFIINSLTDDGFLTISAQEIADDYSLRYLKIVDVPIVQKTIDRIRKLDPEGIATGSIQECMLAQLTQKACTSSEHEWAISVLQHYYEELKSRDFRTIMQGLGITEEDVKKILSLLGTLKLKPVSGLDTEPTELISIIPDFLVIQQGNSLKVVLQNEKSTAIRLTSWNASPTKNTSPPLTKYLTKKYDEAKWFVNAIKQRESTSLKVMNAIVAIQYDYFITGDELTLKPMILKNIADIVGVDISTVSRITCNKYVQTFFGNILIKNLFSKGIPNLQGEIIAVPNVKNAIMKVIHAENKDSPYTDEEIVRELAESGFSIARRTVAKYRHELHVPSAHVRGNFSRN